VGSDPGLTPIFRPGRRIPPQGHFSMLRQGFSFRSTIGVGHESDPNRRVRPSWDCRYRFVTVFLTGFGPTMMAMLGVWVSPGKGPIVMRQAAFGLTS